ncbi:hypothetical protein [Haloplanus litoreus]|uniref:Fibronectin type-III domain-containing protein n=1 Tax=Haloplanus litoreus TaxID=767515 RepID=A0ABD5ZUI0_9EURY
MPTYDTPNSSGTYDPPDGLAEFKLVVVGSEGAGGSETSAGAAGKVEGVLPLSGGESFTLYVAGTVSDGPDGYPTVGAPSPIADGGDSNSTSEVNEWGGAGGAVTVLERDGDGVYVAIAEGGGGGAGTYNPTYNGDHGGGGGARGGIGGQGAQDGGGSGEGGDGGTQENLDADPDIPATAGHPGGTTAIAELTSVTETTESPATPRIEIIDHPRNVSLTVADHTDTTVDLAVDADNSESWTIHRSTSSGFSPDSGNQVASISSGGAQTYTDTGLTQGKIYYYKAVATNPAGSTATSEVSQTTNGPAPTFGSLTVVDDSGDGHADAFDCDFTRGGSDEDHLEIRGSIDNGSSFSQLGTDQTPDTTQYTTPEQDDGQEYVLKVTAVYPDTESDSGTLTRTTDPRDLSQDDITPVDTSVEDQLRIPNPGVADYGDYRGQLRVTNSGDAYGSDVVVAYDGADLVFTGLPDGEKFDLQGRHETEHVNGVWAGVSAITLLPQPGDVQVASIQATQATITWDDTADNEDDILIERRREYADGFGAYEEVVVKAANATQHVDDTIVPGVTYQWRVSNRTEHVVSRATTAQATSNSIRPSNAAPTSGWWAEVDTPSADTPRTPPIVGSPQRDPSVNDLEQVTIPVPKDEGWDSDAFIDAPVRVWHDGKRLPIDQLADRGQTPGATTLIAEGGTALYETDEYQFTNTDVHAAVNAVVDDTPRQGCDGAVGQRGRGHHGRHPGCGRDVPRPAPE